MTRIIQKKIMTVILFLAMLISLVPAVTLPAWAADDGTAPTVTDKNITSSNVSQTGVKLNWNKATDDTSGQGTLQYLVYQSSSDNLGSVENIKTNGTGVGNYTADIATKDITGLSANTTYYFNVIVKDEAGNESCYTTKSVTTTSSGFAGGEGTSGDPYRIASAEQLAYMASLINSIDATTGTCKEYQGKYYILTDDIDLSAGQWTPIAPIWGSYDTSFKGSFDGQGHKITFMIEATDPSMRTAGLFGYVGVGGTVKNLTVDGSVNIANNTDGIRAGSVVGFNEGTISNCTSNMSVTGTETGNTISVPYIYVGGITGANLGSVVSCTSAGDVTGVITVNPTNGVKLNVGGITGTNDANATITDCTSMGDIAGTTVADNGYSWCYAGGILGTTTYSAGAKMSGCVSSGQITCSATAKNGQGHAYAGGFAGLLMQNGLQVEDCSSTCTVSGMASGTGPSPDSSETPDAHADIGGFAGAIAYGVSVSDCYAEGNSSGSAVSSDGDESDVHIGGFAGESAIFSGCSCSIDSCYSTGTVQSGAGKNVYAGGLVGLNFSSVTNCYARGAVSGSATGAAYLGGFLGWNTGTVSDGYATGKVSGSGTGTNYVGGFAGYNDSTATIAAGYFDNQTTGQTMGASSNSNPTASAVSVTGLTTSEMTGTTAESNMSSFTFTGADPTWKTQANISDYWYYPQLADVSGFESVTLPVAVTPNTAVTPANGTTVYGTQTFTFPFKTASGALSQLELDIYLGANTGSGRDYSNAVSINLPADADDVSDLIDGINSLFMTHTRAELVATYGENAVRLYEAAGFVVGTGEAAVVKSNIKYVATSSTTGTWTLTLNTDKLQYSKLEFLVAVHSSLGSQWGHNNYTKYSTLTQAYLYNVSYPTDGDGSGSSGTSNSGAEVIVNGEPKTAGTSKTTTNASGQTVTTVTVDTNKLQDILASEGTGTTVTIPITGDSDVAAGTLTGAMVKNMESKDAILVVQTDSGTYTLPALEINIDAVSQQFGTNVSLSDINVTVSISEPSASMTQVVENAAADGGYTIMVPAVDYAITCTHGSQTVNVSSFDAYVERMIAIPNGVDPSKITTGVVVDPDGTTHHVPTKVTVMNGKYYVVINSLTNSTYSVVWNPIEFSDVTNHWAKDAINDMGSRMVVTGVGSNNYDPERNMTRAEFATIIIRALGLEPGTGVNGFGDVAPTDWFCGYVKTATEHGIINGYDNGNFGPNDTITREQAMTMIARAMKITKLKSGLADNEINTLLKAYTDGTEVSPYATESIAACLKTGIVAGRSVTTIVPQGFVTRAEVAVMVERLLQKSGLI